MDTTGKPPHESIKMPYFAICAVFPRSAVSKPGFIQYTAFVQF